MALGWHGYTDPGYVASTVTYPDIVEQRQMLDDREGKDVVADNGPVSLGCLSDGTEPCSPAVLVPGEGEEWFYLYGLGTDDFLAAGRRHGAVRRRRLRALGCHVVDHRRLRRGAPDGSS